MDDLGHYTTPQTSQSSPCCSNCSPRPPRPRSSPAPLSTTHAQRPVLENERRPDLHKRIHAQGLLPYANARPRGRCSISAPSCPPRTSRLRPSRPPYTFCRRGIVPRCRRGDFFTDLLVPAAPVVVLAGRIAVSRFAPHASRRVVGQWRGACGAVCEDHVCLTSCTEGRAAIRLRES